MYMLHGALIPSITAIPPELFPIIASFVPLRSAPYTLRSLALGNRRFYDIVRPILFSRLILRNENDVITVFQKILDEPHLGLAVTELYVMSELSIEARRGEKPFDALVGLQMLLTKQLVPRLSALGIYLLQGWHFDEDDNLIMSHGRLLADFWRDLRTQCPRLQTLALRNVGHGVEDPWLSGPVIDEINASVLGLSSLYLECSGNLGGFSEEDTLKILKNLPHLTSSLHTLKLESPRDHEDAKYILSLDFPHLKRLCLQFFASESRTSKVMGFFIRHPQLESLALVSCLHEWFSNEIEVGFLPNLKHLGARFDDIRALVVILPQLDSLAFTESCNGQVPYLLRAVLPNGLPRLKSLQIGQEHYDNYNNPDSALEGISWYETLECEFCIANTNTQEKVPRDFMNGYMHSIVRGAPNLEELGLHCMKLSSESLHTLSSTLSQLVHMERFYYIGFSPDPIYGDETLPDEHEELLSDFLSSAEALARVCTRLVTVTSIGNCYLPYISAKIERGAAGDVTRVRRTDGVGMLIPADENDPFPHFRVV